MVGRDVDGGHVTVGLAIDAEVPKDQLSASSFGRIHEDDVLVDPILDLRFDESGTVRVHR
jgi:hypothetical protein